MCRDKAWIAFPLQKFNYKSPFLYLANSLYFYISLFIVPLIDRIVDDVI